MTLSVSNPILRYLWREKCSPLWVNWNRRPPVGPGLSPGPTSWEWTWDPSGPHHTYWGIWAYLHITDYIHSSIKTPADRVLLRFYWESLKHVQSRNTVKSDYLKHPDPVCGFKLKHFRVHPCQLNQNPELPSEVLLLYVLYLEEDQMCNCEVRGQESCCMNKYCDVTHTHTHTHAHMKHIAHYQRHTLTLRTRHQSHPDKWIWSAFVQDVF